MNTTEQKPSQLERIENKAKELFSDLENLLPELTDNQKKAIKTSLKLSYVAGNVDMLKEMHVPQSNIHPVMEQALKPFMPK